MTPPPPLPIHRTGPSPGDFVSTNDTVYDSDNKDTRKAYNYNYWAYDFDNAQAREKWIERITNATYVLLCHGCKTCTMLLSACAAQGVASCRVLLCALRCLVPQTVLLNGGQGKVAPFVLASQRTVWASVPPLILWMHDTAQHTTLHAMQGKWVCGRCFYRRQPWWLCLKRHRRVLAGEKIRMGGRAAAGGEHPRAASRPQQDADL